MNTVQLLKICRTRSNESPEDKQLKEKRVQRLQELDSLANNPIPLITGHLALQEIMAADMKAVIEVSDRHPGNLTWMRIVVRLSFSIIDALCNNIKEIIYCFLKYNSIKPTRKDLMCITGIDERRGVYKQARPGQEEIIKYVTNRLASLSTSVWKISDYSKEWQAFRDSISIRHRLTHPKTLDDLLINFEEYGKVADSLLWFQDGLNQLISKIRTKKPST